MTAVALRLLLSLVTVFAISVASASTWATAGVRGDPTCCCPDPELCKCHEHDKHAPSAPLVKRCGGEASIATPELAAAIVIDRVVVREHAVVRAVITPWHAVELAHWFVEPETPPF